MAEFPERIVVRHDPMSGSLTLFGQNSHQTPYAVYQRIAVVRDDETQTWISADKKSNPTRVTLSHTTGDDDETLP